jgi:hypothetical protein
MELAIPVLATVFWVLLALLPASAAPEEHLVRELPGQEAAVDFRQYAGYVTVDPDAGRALFYYFVTASDSDADAIPSADADSQDRRRHCHRRHSPPPVSLWLNGGLLLSSLMFCILCFLHAIMPCSFSCSQATCFVMGLSFE